MWEAGLTGDNEEMPKFILRSLCPSCIFQNTTAV